LISSHACACPTAARRSVFGATRYLDLRALNRWPAGWRAYGGGSVGGESYALMYASLARACRGARAPLLIIYH